MKKIFAFIFVLLLTSTVFAQTYDEALNAINSAENDIQDMIDANLSAAYVSDILIVAKDALTSKKYDVVIQKAEIIAERKNKAFEISDILLSLNMRISEDFSQGIGVATANETYNLALIEFKNENYDRANMYIDQTYTELNDAEAYTSLVRARAVSLRNNIFYFIIDNWKQIFIGSLITLSVGFVLYRRYYRIYLKRKIENYVKRKRMINRLIKKAQEDRYNKKILSVDTYKLKINQYKEKESEIENTINILRSKLRRFH
ncbi:MAG: hypothetical protein PHU12_01120 [Candidatus Aenigmarchaeota archaeon]|nr:hypothetical protein [Candidatus Aenigmarchaeota archaeon]